MQYNKNVVGENKNTRRDRANILQEPKKEFDCQTFVRPSVM